MIHLLQILRLHFTADACQRWRRPFGEFLSFCLWCWWESGLSGPQTGSWHKTNVISFFMYKLLLFFLSSLFSLYWQVCRNYSILLFSRVLVSCIYLQCIYFFTQFHFNVLQILKFCTNFENANMHCVIWCSSCKEVALEGAVGWGPYKLWFIAHSGFKSSVLNWSHQCVLAILWCVCIWWHVCDVWGPSLV